MSEVDKTLKEFEGRLNTLEGNNKTLAEENEKLKKENEDAKNTLADYEKKGLNAILTKTSSVNSDEKMAMNYFGVSHVKKLLEINTSHTKYKHVPSHLKYLVRELKKDFQNARFISQLFYEGKTDKIGTTEELDKFPSCKSILETRFGKEVLAPKLKAFGTSIVGGGAEWIPTALSSSYIPEFELSRELVAQLREIQMPTSPYELTVAKNMTTARRGTEGVTATESNFNSASIQLKAKKFLEYYILPEELVEDSIIPVLELARAELVEAHKRAFEEATVNGTEFGVAHIDSDTQAGAADLAGKQWDGLRKIALDNSANGVVVDFGNGVVTDALLRTMRARLGKFGVDPTQLLWVTGAISYLEMLGTDNVVTVDKMGANATILEGQLGAYLGIPIIQSGAIREDMNATGVYDGVTSDRTGLMLMRRDRYFFATRRPITLALRESKSADDRYEIASYSRTDFKPIDATETAVAYGMNIALL